MASRLYARNVSSLAIGASNVDVPADGNVICNGNISAANMGMRNRILNGNMKIDQRGTNAPSMPNAYATNGTAGASAGDMLTLVHAANYGGADRFCINTGPGAGSLSAIQVPLSIADQVAVGGAFDEAIALSPLPTQGLIAYIPFDGSNVADTMGLLTNPVHTAPAFSTQFAKMGATCLDLTANAVASATITTGVGYTITQPVSLPLTIAFWMYANNTTTSTICPLFLGNSFNSDSWGIEFMFNAGGAYIDIRSAVGNYQIGNFAVVANTWNHMALTVAYGSVSIVYVNGVQANTGGALPASGVLAGNSQYSINHMRLGSRPSNTSPLAFKGYLDDVRMYNRVLAVSEIMALAKNTIGNYPIMPTSGLQARYQFENNVNDSIGNNVAYNGNVIGSLSYATGVVGNAAFFNNPTNAGTGNIITAVNPVQQVPLSFSFWMNHSGVTASSTILSFTNAAINTPCMNLDFNTSRQLVLNLAVPSQWSVSSLTPPSALNLGQWYHITITVTSNWVTTIYINAVQSSMATGSGNLPAANATNMVIGNNGDGRNRPYNGYLDDMRFYNRCLSPVEITNMYMSAPAAYKNAYVLYQQPIESVNLYDMAWSTSAAQSATVSCWLKNNTSSAQQFTLAVNSPGSSMSTRLPLGGNDWVDYSNGLIFSAFTGGVIGASSSIVKVGSYAADLTSNTLGGTTQPIAGAIYTFGNTATAPQLPFTCAAWIYVPNTISSVQIPICIGPSSGAAYSFQWVINTAGQLYVDLVLNTGTYQVPISASTYITSNTWIHVCSTIAVGGNHILYINGVQAGSVSIGAGTSFAQNTGAIRVNQFRIGSQCGGGSPFKGYLNDMRIYTRALVPQQVHQLYANNVNTTNVSNYLLPRSIVYNTPMISANSWQKVSFTIPGDVVAGYWQPSDNSTGLTLSLCLGANSSYALANVAAQSNNSASAWNSVTGYTGSNVQIYGDSSNNFMAGLHNNVYLTGVQLEKGNVATPFDMRPMAAELQMCQRYYEKMSTTMPGNTWMYKTTKRGLPNHTVSIPTTAAVDFAYLAAGFTVNSAADAELYP
jgi:hypothetical protein